MSSTTGTAALSHFAHINTILNQTILITARMGKDKKLFRLIWKEVAVQCAAPVCAA